MENKIASLNEIEEIFDYFYGKTEDQKAAAILTLAHTFENISDEICMGVRKGLFGAYASDEATILDLKMKQRSECWICGKLGEWDHITTRGAGGSDEPQNLQPLCRSHHIERHRIGIKSFVNKYDLPITFEFGYPRRTDL